MTIWFQMAVEWLINAIKMVILYSSIVALIGGVVLLVGMGLYLHDKDQIERAKAEGK